jgi:16S rRNA (uracil1498-N3)-methyltransferase
MRRALVSPLTDKSQSLFTLSEEESHHLTQVLRVRQGETVECLDGKGHFFTGVIQLQGKGSCQVSRQSEIQTDPDRMAIPTHLEIACLKGDAMDWVIEKCVEIGIQTLFPLITDHTVVQLGRKSPEEFQKRWQKIADQSLKQCGRLERLEVKSPTPFEEVFQKNPEKARIWAYENERTITLESLLSNRPGATNPLTLLIGPEGGWSPKEVQYLQRAQNVQSVSLGPWIYRAETAALVAASLSVSNMRRSLKGNI